MDIDFNIPTIITKRNTDSSGSPISVKLIEVRQVMDSYSCIVLTQIPDELHRIYIEGFTEVFDIERLDKKNFKVDYNQGIVYFHPFNVGKAISIEYYGTGYELISASRVFTKVDKYGNIIDTLESILERSDLQLKLIESLGGAIKVIEKLDENIKNANNLNAYFDEKIPEATELKNELDTIVTDAKGWKDQLKQDVEDGKILQPLLHNDIIQGNATKEQLEQSIANAQDDIAIIEATGNEIINIISSEWVYNDTSGMYEKQIAHSCNSENVQITCKTSDTKEALFLPWKIVDKSNILLKSDESINVSVVISARYYKALIDNTTTQEVIDARKGEVNLKGKIDKIDKELGNIKNNHLSINVKDYGAIGDGVTDDTDAFQNALNKIMQNDSGVLCIPCGIYKINELVINKINANKIIIEGQYQKMDYWNTQNETVKILVTGSKGITCRGVALNIIGVSFIGETRKNIGIDIDGGGRIALHNCKLFGFGTGLSARNIIHDIRQCEITENNIGLSLYNSGDSSIVDCWINTNNIGVSYGQYCANSQIKGGKIEWNEKGIMCISGGLIIEGIQFDFNKYYDIWIEGGTFNGYAFAVHPDNIFNINITGNRFLGSGYVDSEVSSGGACNIWLFKCSEINISSNTFSTSGRHAFDNSGLSNSEPSFKVGPITTFIKIRDSIANVVGNVFNTQYDIPPVMIVDVNKMASRVQYTGNRHTSNREPLIYDFGGVDISGGGNRIYSNVGGINLSKLSKQPTNGTFEYGDVIMCSSPSSIEKWVCTESGTLREKPSINIVSTKGNNYFELSGEIDVNNLQVGDYIKIQYEAKKVIRIVYNDGNEILDSPKIYVNGNIETTYNGSIDYYAPSFRQI